MTENEKRDKGSEQPCYGSATGCSGRLEDVTPTVNQKPPHQKKKWLHHFLLRLESEKVYSHDPYNSIKLIKAVY